MTESSADPALTAAEERAAAALLTATWGERTEIRAAETIWDRRHVVRLRCGPGRSVVLKRRGDQEHGRRGLGFGVELAALEYLNAMPVPVAPRLLGADSDAGIMLMEDLGTGASLADSLLGGDRARAQADMIAYARAMGSLHAWSMGHPGDLAGLQARYAPRSSGSRSVVRPAWIRAVEEGADAFLDVTTSLGLPTHGVRQEIAEVAAMLTGPSYAGLVHGDACPDNVQLLGGTCRIFDFEISGWASVTLDASYLLAPFPSCWCFASLPAEVATPAIEAYRSCLQSTGIDLGPGWEAATAAALATWIVARGPVLARVLDEDRPWGTTTMRPRLLTWLRSFTGAAARASVLPRLHGLAGVLHERLSVRWPGTAVPDYPALAQPGSASVHIPRWWPPAR